MYLYDFLLLLLISTYVTANLDNVTEEAVQWFNNDDCTNECSDNENHNYYWCGKFRTDPEGYISRCVQYTYKGDICVNECGGDKKYNWCLINAYQISSGDWWDYCSLDGFTVNKEKCFDDCNPRGESYSWCHTSATDNSEWDYCSQPGLVNPVEINRKGEQCINPCDEYDGYSYSWCARSMSYCNEDIDYCDDDWEYCSKDEWHTRYGKECKAECSLGGESYYWCNTKDGSWDYCSPKATAGVHVSLEIELTRYGVKCRSVCKTAGEKYFWCEQVGGGSSSWWDYCSPENLTINDSPCTDGCLQRGKNYFWCHTKGSWDYCSPRNDDTFGYTSIYAGAATTTLHFASIFLVLWCIRINLWTTP